MENDVRGSENQAVKEARQSVDEFASNVQMSSIDKEAEKQKERELELKMRRAYSNGYEKQMKLNKFKILGCVGVVGLVVGLIAAKTWRRRV